MPAPRFIRRIDPTEQPIVADKNQLFKFKKTRGDGRMKLVDLIGQGEHDAIVASGSIEFEATGDTGKGDNTQQSEVIEAMTRDFVAKHPERGATFFLNLGDIIYGPGKLAGYANKFYRPNSAWLKPAPGFKGIILGIPGNHDGEVRDERDNPSLVAFEENFCQPPGKNPEMATSFGAVMPNQPGAYWWLEAPYLDLIGLYSNAAEDFGILGVDAADTHQQKWLTKSLKAIAAARQNSPRRALLIATHHPPFNQGLNAGERGHQGSPEMLAQIDAACVEAGVWPDMFLSGHSHNYQLYMRTVLVDGKNVVIPYVIAGTGGIGSQPAPANVGNMSPDRSVTYASGLGAKNHQTAYGYLRIRASATIVQATFVQALSDHRKEVETVAIDLATGQKTVPLFTE